jgi:ATP-dependent Lon protease
MPDKMPVMVLDDCYLFPGCFLPLFIFEERYRKMLGTALDTDRMFCIGSRVQSGEGEELIPVSTAAIIRACRKQNDGTSHVMLYGISRIRFTGWLQEKPFRLASVEPLPTAFSSSIDELNRLKADALAMLPKPAPQCSEAMQVLRTTLQNMPCPEMVCDILAYHFVKQPAAQRALLLEPVLEKRFQKLLEELEMLPGAE